jgi:hypothetical protein
VATTGDLTALHNEMQSKLDDHKKWSENCITDFVMKLRGNIERIDSLERDQNADIETMKGDMKALRAGNVTNAAFRQQNAIFEKRFEQEKEESIARIEALKLALEKEIIANIGSLRTKSETLNASCIALTEKARLQEETLIPQMRTELEEQKAKRLAESQRLEAEIEKMKDLCEQKIAQTAAALRFFVTAQSTKLQEECAPMTGLKTMEEDVKQLHLDAKARQKSVEENFSQVKAELASNRANFEAFNERLTGDLGQHTKSLKVQEITMTNLQNSLAADLNSMRETLKHDRASVMTEVAEARAASSRQAQTSDQAIQSMSGELSSIRQFREQVMDRLHIEQIVSLVREWQGQHVPQVTSSLKDFEERLRKMATNQHKDHEVICDLTRSTTAIRGHFKMFHAIAAGLDDKPHPNEPEKRVPDAHTVQAIHSSSRKNTPDDMKLPPINTPR